ncbi:MAG TPA: fused MFS/spermidine synthase [Flavobacterium sp.]|nr:fused MFS/spermidine synthase [Flavobacterium sp.]
MSLLKKYFSYLGVINEKKYESAYNGILEINWLNGKKVLDTENTNYSYGNLGKVLHKALKSTKTNFKNESCELLVLGLGGGDVIKQLRTQFHSEAKITAVEIDPVMIEVAMNEFQILPGNQLDIVNEDAELFLKYTKKTFDVIIVDLFYDVTIPSFVFNPSFITSILKTLRTNGSVIFNTFILEDVHEQRNNQLIDLLKHHFELQSFKNIYGHNHLIIAQNKL